MSAADTEARISALLAGYTPAMEAALRDARTRLRALFPRGHELIFDNYNALVFAFGPTERAADAFISVAGYPRWVTLFFAHGTELDDPAGLLEGAGKRVRSIRLKAPADIDEPAVQALVAQALSAREAALRAAPALATVVKGVAARQRSRRPASSGSPPGKGA